ncbi:hypothetical protein KL905_000251 [Ogataea polymorpha]|uniref:Uncharacterized protein n=1 Tax=Ogataea polymorpha TaxID=460523 RepID=A0A1B7SIW0_9ASCO|nr:uncharacterized protein OGAPODRAFT_93404 [Ogataea polymorpha]KAG7882254.1 hypothetical protein KL937_000825 [Ogataea polymorpha]KAG7895014.1 hypothetical protein KL908_001364 [Ogataea polymorpha]KAG7902503.1 hypothetical protein KL935_001411 [Ogataea polymorpha]KAG7911509.1 hypothetical protein KL906_000830 [Ogataea polymorpha]KAG7912658.1 hypothetical protein KL907_000860 [Ogataea polymorpha]
MAPFCKFTLDLKPSEGLGFIELGRTLYQIFLLLREHGMHNDIRFIYANDSKTTILQLTKLNINLVFDACSQVLLLIEINQVGNYGVEYKYKGESMSSFHFKHIYNKIFGPTYPGTKDEASKSYRLSYPGIAFLFNIEGVALNQGSDDLIRTLNNNNYDINCYSIAIFKGDSWHEGAQKIRDVIEDTNMTSKVRHLSELFPSSHAPQNTMGYASIDLQARPSVSIPEYAQVTLVIGVSTMQEITSKLGPPDDTLLKYREITSYGSKGIKIYKIHNYFRYGLDLIYVLDEIKNGSSILAKITIHCNVENSLEFLKYEKLNFKIESLTSTDTVYSHQPFDEIQKLLPRELKNKFVFLNRKEYEINSFSINSDNAFEVIDYEDNFDSSTSVENESTSSTNAEENEEYKNWGLTKLFGYGRCLFEILIDGNRISSITIV